MNRFPQRLLLPCGALACAFPTLAQEALRDSLTSERAASQTRGQLEQTPYTIRWGDLRLLVSPALSIAYDDNVNLSNTTQEDDFILTPSVNLNALYPIGEVNVLTFFVNVGYSKYFDHDELDRLTILPGSALSFDLFIKDLRFNFHERLSYQLDPTVNGSVSGQSEYGGLQNTIGVLATWDLQDIVLNVGYDYLRYMSAQSEFEHQDRNTHQLVARGGVQVHPSLTTGLEATASPTQYEQSYLNNNVGYSVGVYADWQVSEAIHFQPRGGYVIHSFEANEFSGPIDDYGAWYFGLLLDHKLSESVTYALSATHEITPGVYSNLTDLWRAEVRANWSFIRNFPFNTSLYYEHGKEASLPITEVYDRVGANIGFSYQLMEKLSASLSYGYIIKDSETENRDYAQNRVTLSFSYRL